MFKKKLIYLTGIILAVLATSFLSDSNVKASVSFFDGFESGFGNWNTVIGTPSASSAQAHGGSNSYVMNEDMDVIYHDVGSSINGVVVVWFYDDKADTSVKTIAQVSGVSGDMKIGVVTSIMTDKYVYNKGGDWISTGKGRKTGWHQFVWDYRSGTDVALYIDGTPIASSTAVTSFNQINMGDIWGGGITGTVYFDDVGLQDDLP